MTNSNNRVYALYNPKGSGPVRVRLMGSPDKANRVHVRVTTNNGAIRHGQHLRVSTSSLTGRYTA